MSPIVREMSTTEEHNAPLRRLAKEAATMIKKRTNERYTTLLSRVQQKLDIKKAERRKIRTQQVCFDNFLRYNHAYTNIVLLQFVTDPELAAKRKIAKQQKKKEARKRKSSTIRGKKVVKKRPKKEVDLDII